MQSRFFLNLIISLFLTGCSTYQNKFKGNDAKGLEYTMVRDVDMQIKSGQIDEIYKTKKRCFGRKCSSFESNLNEVPILAPSNRAVLNNEEIENIDSIIDENNLYF